MPDGWINRHIPQAHCEEANDTWEYERKEHTFWCSEDTTDVLKIRYGKPTKLQKEILKQVETQNDRQIDVYFDKEGNHGKSWLSVWLFEQGRGFIIPRSEVSASKLSAFVCSAYRREPYIIVDIPRSRKIDTTLYEALEELKDGLVFDGRYTGRTRNIRGAKLIVFTNVVLDKKRLSMDRWRLHNITDRGINDIDLKKLSTKTQIHTRQTKVDKLKATGLNRTAKEEQKCTEDADITDAGATDAGTDTTAGAGGEVQ